MHESSYVLFTISINYTLPLIISLYEALLLESQVQGIKLIQVTGTRGLNRSRSNNPSNKSLITNKFCKKKISERKWKVFFLQEEIHWRQKPSGNGSIHHIITLCLGILFKLYLTIQSIAKEYYDWKEIESK